MKQLFFTTHYRNSFIKFLAILLIFCQGFGLSHQYLYDLELNDNKILELNDFAKIPTKNNSESHMKITQQELNQQRDKYTNIMSNLKNLGILK